jgi:hypothetical protein
LIGHDWSAGSSLNGSPQSGRTDATYGTRSGTSGCLDGAEVEEVGEALPAFVAGAGGEGGEWGRGFAEALDEQTGVLRGAAYSSRE